MAPMNFLLGLITVSMLSATGNAAKLNTRDSRALFAIRSAFSSYGSAKLNTWSSAADCSKWAGVTCDKTNKRVTRLELPSKGIRGKLSSAVGNLTFLISLDLSRNKLSSVIPESVGKLVRIRKIQLQYNTFTGAIPRSMAAYPLMVSMRLDHNLLTGTPIRTFISNFVYYVDLSANYLGGDGTIKKKLRQLCRVVTSTRGLNMALNCIRFNSFLEPCYNFQRPSGECRNFCQANFYLGACGGHGQCLKSGSSFRCVCDKGFKLSSSNKFLCA